MKLCRFSLHDTPETVRSGIFFENRVYETVGDKAAGIHELTKVTFLSPISRPIAIRLFHSNGYRYVNPGALAGPGDELDLPLNTGDLTLEVRLGMLLKDGGLLVEPEEAPDFILGYTWIANLASEQATTYDLPLIAGPFITTVDEFAEFDSGPLSLDWTLQVNNTDVHQGATVLEGSPFEYVCAASQTTTLNPSDLLGFPSLIQQPLRLTALGRPLQPNDQIQIQSPRLGTLNFSVS